MAPRLQSNDGKVVQLKPRKAKGAGGQKRKGPSTNRLKPRPGESKPAAARKSDQPSDADVRRSTQDRLVALHQKHRSVEGKMAIASEAMSTLREEKAQIRASIQNTCVPLAIYDEAHKKITAKTKRQDNEEYEKLRALCFEAFGLPIGPQPELDLKDVPQAARPAVHWEAVGYSDGINGDASDPTAAGVPPENLQDYMRGYSQAMARNGAGLGLLKDDPPKTPKASKTQIEEAAEPKNLGEDKVKARVKYAAAAMKKGDDPAWNGFPADPDDWADAERDVFTLWYDSLGDREVDIAHVGAGLMFDKLFEAEQAPEQPTVAKVEEPVESNAGPAPVGIDYMLTSEEPFASGRQATYHNGQPIDTAEAGTLPYYDEHPDDFEASAEELAGQKPRKAAQERKEAEQEAAFSED